MRLLRPGTMWLAAWLLAMRAAIGAEPSESSLAPAAVDLPALRQFYLADIHELRDYRPGKNSYVEGPDRRVGCYRAAGQRLTLLDVEGAGRLCHLWSTWRAGQGACRLEFYLDGAKSPQIVGTLDELITAARRMADPPVPITGFVGNREARNLFLPVPFQRGLRIEMETIEPTWLIFWQIDYRLEEPTRGEPERLLATTVDGQLSFHWHGRTFSAPTAVPPTLRRVQETVAIPAGENQSIGRVAGPGIVRAWSIQTDCPAAEHDRLDLEVSYDEARRPGVRASVADFFGPFRSVAFESDMQRNRRTCYLPMPVGRKAIFALHNRLPHAATITFSADVEPAPAWNARWGYFHALGRITARTNGFRQHEVLYVRGRGHWLGMTLYATGHDHGGGDFAVVDGEGRSPAFLHGINGEDYFTFAWFGRGAHHPFAVADTNVAGRGRLHFENPYPFGSSLNLYWGAYPDLAPRSVAYWYQDSPDDTTVSSDGDSASADWDCFGPVPLKLDADHRVQGDPFAVLPTVADLDAGRKFPCRCVSEEFIAGWTKVRSFGPMLDLTYLARSGTRIKGEVELGGMGHALLARRHLHATAARRSEFQLSHDDPIRVRVNGREVYRGAAQAGFATRSFPVDLQAGDNEIVVELTNFFNVNFNWAGFALRTP